MGGERVFRSAIKENTARVVAAGQNNVLLLWRVILNHTRDSKLYAII